MVFCRECKRKVDDCPHLVPPLNVPPIPVFDPKVKTVAYKSDARILEIAFKNGQVWQLSGVPPDIYDALRDTTLSSFLKFIAHRYNPRPVRQAARRTVTDTEPCPDCKMPMTQRHKTGNGQAFVRVLWNCPKCNRSRWLTYGTPDRRERKSRWH